MGYSTNQRELSGTSEIHTDMKLKTLTKDEVKLLYDPLLNKMWGLDEMIYAAQIEGKTEIVFSPALIVRKEVTKVFSSSPFNFAVTETNLANQMVSVTKISWI